MEEINESGAVRLLRAVFINLFAKIEKSFDDEWLREVILWADRKDNFWLNHFEAIFEYDRVKVAEGIKKAAQRKLSK